MLLAAGLAALGVVLLLAVFALAGGALIAGELDEAQRAAVAAALQGRWGLLWLPGLVLAGIAGAAVPGLYRRWVAAPAQLAEQAQVLVGSGVRRELAAPPGAASMQRLAEVVNGLARERDRLRDEIADEVARASRGIELERSRLAALMSELTQAVVVCNLDGRVLLYNQRAREQFRALSGAPGLADGAELLGLGRSIHQVFDRRLVTHALDTARQRQARGHPPSTHFVTVTRSGQLLRAQLTLVGANAAPAAQAGDPAATPATPTTAAASSAAEAEAEPSAVPAAPAPPTGFVLLLDNVTQQIEQDEAREKLLQSLTEESRGSLANLQAAVEMLDDAGLPPELRERFLGVVREESQAMAQRLRETAQRSAEAQATRWPLENMLGADLVQAAVRRIEAAGGPPAAEGSVDGALWLRVDSFSLLQALVSLALRLREELEAPAVELCLSPDGAHRARLDLAWTGQPLNTETAMGWELDAMRLEGGEPAALSVRDVVQRHGGEFWFERERVRQRSFFRFLLPLAAAPQAPSSAATAPGPESGGGRPEFYDFDLFAVGEAQRALDDRPLAELDFTVFDTETTGLDPGGGDKIIQIGAARLVNGRLLKGECFEQLVDPRRSIPEAGIPIHGITPDMVRGKPTIETVLPAFHAYAEGTVLVAHNAAFDMRFLQLEEAACGVRFDHPVLDTLLLSAVVHPNQTAHRLEAIAERLDVPVSGRHNALGDALVTAEVFRRLIPLLAEQGIRTVAEARAAAERTYYARLKY